MQDTFLLTWMLEDMIWYIQGLEQGEVYLIVAVMSEDVKTCWDNTCASCGIRIGGGV